MNDRVIFTATKIAGDFLNKDIVFLYVSLPFYLPPPQLPDNPFPPKRLADNGMEGI